MADYKYNTVELTIPAPDNLEYSHRVEIPVFLGFKIISQKEYNMTSSQTNETGNLLYYQSLQKTGLQYNYIESKITANFKHNHYTEASLIQELETRGIGRPSTFSSIVSTIQERGYVTRCDTDGETIACKDFRLESNTITHTVEDKVFGKERNKLVIQNLGILTIEFLLKHFAEIFAYDYTETMENALDKIAQPELYPDEETQAWYTLCSQCYNKLKLLRKPIRKLEKQLFKIDHDYDVLYISGKHVLRKTLEDGSIEFKSIKPNIKIDLEKLKTGEYTIDDLIELKNDCLGKYKDHNVYLKMDPVSVISDKKNIITSSLRKINKLAIRLSSHINNPNYIRKTSRRIEHVANKIVFNARNIKKTSKRIAKFNAKKKFNKTHRKK
jgi:DNA topoisomerase-1